jgi:hypothetical protein
MEPLLLIAMMLTNVHLGLGKYIVFPCPMSSYISSNNTIKYASDDAYTCVVVVVVIKFIVHIEPFRL